MAEIEELRNQVVNLKISVYNLQRASSGGFPDLRPREFRPYSVNVNDFKDLVAQIKAERAERGEPTTP